LCTVVTQREIQLSDGRVVTAYDGGPAGPLTVFWHHGSPQTGAPLEPVLAAAARRGIRLLAYGRPGYGASTSAPGRDVASAAQDTAQVADAFEVERFAVMGASGGGSHALACVALLPQRATAAVCLAAPAPFTDDFDWFAGMQDTGGLRAARQGRPARARYQETAKFDETCFVQADWDALASRWASLGEDAQEAGRYPDGMVDDDLAFTTPWGFDVGSIERSVLLVQGGLDRVIPPAHADWLLRHCPRAELWLRPHDGHISVLDASPLALDWLLALHET
jgi:pimeloyl-ACP methyl ester carboxylesterase